jgi:uncharacterized protein YaaN involved in tellurite resistance
MTTIQLTPPEALPLVEQQDIQGTVTIKAETVTNLNQQVDDFLKHLIQLDLHEQKFRQKVESVHQLGNKSMHKTSVLSHRLLSRSMKKLGDDQESKKVGENLIELRQTLEALNPANNQKFFAIRKILNVLPFGHKIEDYFDKYKSSEEHINVILNSLENGKDELIKDNIAIDRDKVALWETMQEIEQYIYIGKELDDKLKQVIVEVELVDQNKATLLNEEVYFYIKQKITDLMTQQAVNIQAYMSLDLIRRNNLELIKGVDRAMMTTVSALQTAMVVAQALANQKLVLNQVKMINSTTEDLIVSTSKMLNKQTKEIQSQSSNAMIDVEKLQTAFDHIFETIDIVNDFKVRSLPNLQKSMDHLSIQLERAKQYTDQVRHDVIENELSHLPLATEPQVHIG